MKKLLFLVFAISAFSFPVSGQTLKTLEKLDEIHQTCLDTGSAMLFCTQQYYGRMDSLLNVAYRNYRATLPQNAKVALKTEQLKWLAERDAYFNRINQDYAAQEKAGNGGSDARMIAIDEKAAFVKKRVIYFIRKISAT